MPGDSSKLSIMFQFQSVDKSFGALHVLDQISFSITAGQTTAIIGPSGCGKSTILRLMLGITYPDSGTVSFHSAPITPASVQSLRRKLGYVVQAGGLFPHLSATGNVSISAKLAGWDPQRIKNRITELAELVQLPSHCLTKYPQQLSGGQKQRVSMMRALMLDPEVLLLDEPMAALDPLMRFELQTDLKKIFRKLGKTVILVTHEMGEAAFFASQILLLRSGVIEQTGSVEDLVERPASPFVTQFITAQRAIFDGVEP